MTPTRGPVLQGDGIPAVQLSFSMPTAIGSFT